MAMKAITNLSKCQCEHMVQILLSCYCCNYGNITARLFTGPTNRTLDGRPSISAKPQMTTAAKTDQHAEEISPFY